MKNYEVNTSNLTTEEIATLEAIIAKANTPKGTPAIGQSYFYLYSSGKVKSRINQGKKSDKKRIALGNCFMDEDAANFASKKVSVLAQLAKLSNGFVPGTTDKWYGIKYDCREDVVKAAKYDHTVYPGVAFATKDECQNAIDTVGADDIMTYYFGM